VASSVIVAAVWGMREGLAMLVVGLAFPTYYRLAAGRGLKATPIGDHEAETTDSLAILAASNTRATLARLPPGFTVFNDLKFASVNVDHVVVGPSGVWAMETQANPGFVQERGGSVWVDCAPMGKDPRRQARAGLPLSPSCSSAKRASGGGSRAWSASRTPQSRSAEICQCRESSAPNSCSPDCTSHQPHSARKSRHAWCTRSGMPRSGWRRVAWQN
jgi:hypothetical protein